MLEIAVLQLFFLARLLAGAKDCSACLLLRPHNGATGNSLVRSYAAEIEHLDQFRAVFDPMNNNSRY